MYTPETAAVGTAQVADTLQLPASTNPIEVLPPAAGYPEGMRRMLTPPEETDVATLRAPRPW
jgi:hypothetical protein